MPKYSQMTDDQKKRECERTNNWQKKTGYKKRWRTQRVTDPKTWALQRIADLRSNANYRNIPFELVAEDLILPTVCPVLGIPIVLGNNTKAMRNPSAPSVDRFDNTKGYTKDNVRVISNRANLLKRDGTLEEMRAIVRYMEEG